MDMDFSLLLKTWAISIVENFLIVLKNLQQMQKKTASKSAIQKIAEATGDLIGTKISDKISKRSPKELHSQNVGKIEIERYISSEKIIDESRLVWQYNNGISYNNKFIRHYIK